MTEASVSFAGNLTDDPELRHTEAGIARAMFRVAVSGCGTRSHRSCERPSMPRPGHDHYPEGDRPEWALQCRA
jgi:hypothetical protein